MGAGVANILLYQPPELTRYSHFPRTQLTWQMAQVSVGEGLWNTYYTYVQLHQKVFLRQYGVLFKWWTQTELQL